MALTFAESFREHQIFSNLVSFHPSNSLQNKCTDRKTEAQPEDGTA